MRDEVPEFRWLLKAWRISFLYIAAGGAVGMAIVRLCDFAALGFVAVTIGLGLALASMLRDFFRVKKEVERKWTPNQ